ncbi:MAG: hypothetical protein EOM23_06045, partial [Candidatus Moranbacteria bacterium]|nr:hypothetical protein [Candidatus Moranbacteria bacterium]
MKVKVRPDIIEHLEKQGFKKDRNGDWCPTLHSYENGNEQICTDDMITNETFDVVNIGDNKYYEKEFDHMYQKDWLIFEEEDEMQTTQKDTPKEEYLIEAVAEMKKELDFLK